ASRVEHPPVTSAVTSIRIERMVAFFIGAPRLWFSDRPCNPLRMDAIRAQRASELMIRVGVAAVLVAASACGVASHAPAGRAGAAGGRAGGGETPLPGRGGGAGGRGGGPRGGRPPPHKKGGGGGGGGRRAPRIYPARPPPRRDRAPARRYARVRHGSHR